MKFVDRLSALGFASYDAYLRGDHWSDFKRRYRASKMPMRCVVCGHAKIQLHHHDYGRIGSELFTDVTPLCGEHHEKVHAVLKEKSWFVSRTNDVVVLLRGANLPCVSSKPGRRLKKKKAKIVVLPGKKPRKKCEQCFREYAICNFKGEICHWCKRGQSKKKVKGKNGKKIRPPKVANPRREPNQNPYLRQFLGRS